MTKVLFDHQIFSLQDYGGISRYFYQLMKHLHNDEFTEFEFPLYFSHNRYLKKAEFSNHHTFFPNLRFGLKNSIVKRLKGKNPLHSINALKDGNFDIFHPTFFNNYFIEYLNRKPFVLTIHDMIHEIFPDQFSNYDLVVKNAQDLIRLSSHVIAVSENTKQDVIKYYGTDEKKISVIYHGTSIHEQYDYKIYQKLDSIPDNYLLFLGVRKNYKNFNTFIKAAAALIKSNVDLYVVCAGGKRFSQDELNLMDQLGIRNKTIYFKIFNDEELVLLYKNAQLFIFPSFYEGFGIPILEAFACGCPVALSEASSFPEVAGDAAVYFNPGDIDSIISGIKKVIYNDDLRKELISKGTERIKLFSWTKTANETKKVYEYVSHKTE